MFSRGSVIPEFLKQKQNGCFFITDPAMTRFNITLDQSIDMVIFALKNNLGGEIFVPKIPSYKVIDLAKAICPKTKIKIIGRRYGEKIHEDLISEHESNQTIDIGKYYILLNTNSEVRINQFIEFYGGKKVSKEFFYNSFLNKSYLTTNDLKKIIKV
jgi:FlaA1/EpsC-like NDP-sugar epimerase